MTIQQLSVAVIGAGMAGQTHANAWRQADTVYHLGLPPVRLRAIADAHTPFAEDAARRYGYEKAYGSWQQVVEDPEVDIVSIVVGNALHREIAVALAEAGKHVLCEKPLADTLESAREMADLEARHPGLVLATGYTFRRNPGVAQLARLAREGLLGDVAHLDARYWCDYGADPRVPMAWRYTGPMGAGRRRLASGRLSRVRHGPDRGGFRRAADADDQAAPRGRGCRRRRPRRRGWGGRAPGGGGERRRRDVHRAVRQRRGRFSCSRVAFGHPNSMQLTALGTRGTAAWDLARTGELRLADASSPDGLGGFRQVLANPSFPYFARGSSMAFPGVGLDQISQFTYQAHAFLQQVAGITGEEALLPCATFADGYRQMRILDAVARSAASGGAAVAID